jgi:hypothetical protein
VIYSKQPEYKGNMTRQKWKFVVVYYILACAISWPFFWWKDVHGESWDLSPIPEWIRFMGLMWGPGIAALSVSRFFALPINARSPLGAHPKSEVFAFVSFRYCFLLSSIHRRIACRLA